MGSSLWSRQPVLNDLQGIGERSLHNEKYVVRGERRSKVFYSPEGDRNWFENGYRKSVPVESGEDFEGVLLHRRTKVEKVGRCDDRQMEVRYFSEFEDGKTSKL